ncbi:hypothetical protein DFA_07776 [Cavenderia fasciculata]|uniref:GATA-type domain-containing protein n=1 Tax=Cavenderia fasciculata TaxID=261658 RepID=F4Q376_CACFS|nr:uncharacterized protein DFA_07776 [Cavenderia fasciculata]EGG16798.1 hypothetical protein DFA_07776 [Cavenderia fasciculata]|eukprot:XP_004355272.1 hypothetical protein DFA_07776 [Cavenderia fasciculata]
MKRPSTSPSNDSKWALIRRKSEEIAMLVSFISQQTTQPNQNPNQTVTSTTSTTSPIPTTITTTPQELMELESRVIKLNREIKQLLDDEFNFEDQILSAPLTSPLLSPRSPLHSPFHSPSQLIHPTSRLMSPSPSSDIWALSPIQEPSRMVSPTLESIPQQHQQQPQNTLATSTTSTSSSTSSTTSTISTTSTSSSITPSQARASFKPPPLKPTPPFKESPLFKAAQQLREEQEKEKEKRRPSRSPTPTPASTAKEAKKRGRPAGTRPEQCAICKKTETPEWRKGKNGIDLCNACGLQYRKKTKKEKESKQRHSIINILDEKEIIERSGSEEGDEEWEQYSSSSGGDPSEPSSEPDN